MNKTYLFHEKLSRSGSSTHCEHNDTQKFCWKTFFFPEQQYLEKLHNVCPNDVNINF